MLITPDAGHPLSSVLPENAASSYRKAGNLLRHMHTTFKHATGAIPQELLSISTKDSGHPVQNFCHRFIERKSNATNAFCSHEIPFQFPMLHRLQESIANILQDMRQKCSAIDCQQEDNDIIFGDYKPDNILISKLGELCLIDPDIRRGKECFDIAKFVSRVLLEGETAFPLLTEFSAGYGHIEPSELHYGNLEFKEQVLLDLINILSAYLGRCILGQRSFRLVQQLSDEQYCNYLVRLVTTLSSCSEDLSPSPIEIAVLSVSHA
jgi:serine/threonine protein kinase